MGVLKGLIEKARGMSCEEYEQLNEEAQAYKNIIVFDKDLIVFNTTVENNK